MTLGVSLGVAVPVGAKPPVDVEAPPVPPPGAGVIAATQAGHFRGRLPAPSPGEVGPFQRLPAVDNTVWNIVEVRKQPYWKAGKRDEFLSNACQLGQFGTPSFNHLVVRFTAQEAPGLLQIVPPNHGHLLFDLRHLAQAGQTYYFRDSGLPSCEVWSTGRGKPRGLDPQRGTSLPAADPNALQKRQEIIAGWP